MQEYIRQIPNTHYYITKFGNVYSKLEKKINNLNRYNDENGLSINLKDNNGIVFRKSIKLILSEVFDEETSKCFDETKVFPNSTIPFEEFDDFINGRSTKVFAFKYLGYPRTRLSSRHNQDSSPIKFNITLDEKSYTMKDLYPGEKVIHSSGSFYFTNFGRLYFCNGSYGDKTIHIKNSAFLLKYDFSTHRFDTLTFNGLPNKTFGGKSIAEIFNEIHNDTNIIDTYCEVDYINRSYIVSNQFSYKEYIDQTKKLIEDDIKVIGLEKMIELVNSFKPSQAENNFCDF